MNVQINSWAIKHNHLFRKYLLLPKTFYMFRLFHKAIDRHRLKHIGENKHIILLRKRELRSHCYGCSYVFVLYIGRN